MIEIIEFDNKGFQSALKKLLRVDVLTGSDLEKSPGCLVITFDDEEDKISQHDMDILLKYVKLVRFSKYNFTNMVFKGNGTNKISFKECTFSNCTFEDAVILTQVDEDFLRYGNSKIEVEINNLKELQYICKNNKKHNYYSFGYENDTNKQSFFMQSYSWDEIIEINNIFKMIRLIVPSNISKFDKLLIVSVLLCRNISVDDRGIPGSEEYNRLSEKDKKIFESLVSTFKGSLLHGIGICLQYSECLQWGLDAVGINSREVVSDSHAWNQIELDGNGNWFNFCLTNLRDFFKSGKIDKFFPYLFLTSNERIATLGEMYTPAMECKECKLNYKFYLFEIMEKIDKINSIFTKEMPLGWKQFDLENANVMRDSLEESLKER